MGDGNARPPSSRPGSSPPAAVREIALRELGPEDVTRLAEAHLGPLPEGVGTLLRERAGGNPFYVEELARHLLESGLLATAAEGRRLLRAPGPDDLPEGIEAVIAAHRGLLDLAVEIAEHGLGAAETPDAPNWFEGPPVLAVEILSPSPGFDEDPERYLAFGYRVLAELSRDPRSPADGRGGESLAIPTWYYGHEPSNQFATHVAKYFANSAREAGLVTIATRGIVFAPGSAGTIQEIFMDATQNYYVTEGVVSPMVLLGAEYWREALPVAPLLEKLAAKRAMAELVAVVDSVDEVVAFLETVESKTRS